MPLHLLGKKTWNVYNQTNIDRVRRDEAEEAARQEVVEQRMQDEDAARRTALLRGETPPPIVEIADDDSHKKRRREDDGSYNPDEKRRRRKRRGEDDTDLEMRLARDNMQIAHDARENLVNTRRENSDSQRDRNAERSIVNASGHVDLFPEPESRDKGLGHNDVGRAERGQKHERRRQQKEDRERRREEDADKGMKFSDAAGYNAKSQPWYTSRHNDEYAQKSTIDVFGNEDTERVRRDEGRQVSSDPMAVMMRAQTQLKSSQRDREKYEATRKKEIERMKSDEKRSRRERRHERHHDRDRRRRDDSLNGFRLDDSAALRHADIKVR